MEIHRISFSELKEQVINQVIKHQEHETARRKDQLEQLLKDIFLALHGPSAEQTEQNFWEHQNIEKSKVDIDQTDLLVCLREYLEDRWMQHEYLDWVFMDALLWHAVLHVHQAFLSGSLTGFPNYAYILADGKREKTALLELIFGGIGWIFSLTPLFFLVYLFSVYEQWAWRGLALYGAYLLATRLRGRGTDEGESDEFGRETLDQLYICYDYTAPPFISIEVLKRHLSKASDVMSPIPSELFILLDSIVERNGSQLRPFSSFQHASAPGDP